MKGLTSRNHKPKQEVPQFSYLSMSLSRRPARIGRRPVQRSNVTMSVFSVTILITSARTCNSQHMQMKWNALMNIKYWRKHRAKISLTEEFSYPPPPLGEKELEDGTVYGDGVKEVAYTMISHLLHCTNGPLNIISFPISIYNLQQQNMVQQSFLALACSKIYKNSRKYQSILSL